MEKKTPRKRQAISKDETKAERFVRVVTPRVGKAVKSIRVIGYCAGSAYEVSPAQVKQIIEVLSAALDSLADRFSSKPDAQETFEFTG